MNLEHRTKALLDLVDDYRRRRGDELLSPAHADASATIRAALAEARRRVRTAIAEERRRWSAQIGAAEAALATDRRLAQQRHVMNLLTAAWATLRSRLLAQWHDASGRARWIDAHLQRALPTVPHAGGWRIEHAPDFGADERAQCEAVLGPAGIVARFEAVASIDAGFRVINGHNELDATLDGLLAERAALEGRLLHYLDETAPVTGTAS